MSTFPNPKRMASCVQLAREASRNSWQWARGDEEAYAYRQLRDEAMIDARYWRDGDYEAEPKRFRDLD